VAGKKFGRIARVGYVGEFEAIEVIKAIKQVDVLLTPRVVLGREPDNPAP